MQENKQKIILAVFAALGGLAAILGYFDAKKHREVQRENLQIEKELAQLKLMMTKNEAKKIGL